MEFDGSYNQPQACILNNLVIEDNEIGQVRAMGGDVMVSIGGAANTPLALIQM